MTAAERLVQRAKLYDVRALCLEEVPSRPPGPGEVRLAVEACGLCGSDLHIYSGHHPVLQPPLVMGHEFVSRVVDIGPDVHALASGERVVAIAGRGCGECAACRDGHFNWCRNLQVIGCHIPGGLSEEVVLPADQLVKVPEWLSRGEAALVEVAAVAIHSVHRYGPVEDRRCVILGTGPVGLALIKVLRALGAGRIVASDVNPVRRDLAVQAGADAVVDGSDAEAEPQLLDQFPLGFDVGFDCAGQQETLLQTLRLARRGGTVVLTAIFPRECTLPMLEVQRAERSLVGVQMYERVDFDEVVRLLEEGALDLKGIVTHEFPLTAVHQAFELLSTPGAAAGKILVTMEKST